MHSEHPVLDAVRLLERGVGDFLSHHRTIEDFLMSKVQELSAALKTLLPQHQDTVAKLAATEAERDDLKAKLATAEATIADNESTASADLDSVTSAIKAESEASAAASTPVVTTSPTGATVTVDPSVGTTTHVDPATSTTTTVPHDGSAPTAVDTSMTPAQPVEPTPVAVMEATDATTAAGVTIGTGSDTITGGLGNDLVHADPTLAQ